MKNYNLLLMLLAIFGIFFYKPLVIVCGILTLISFIGAAEKFKLIPMKGFSVWLIALFVAKIITSIIKNYDIVQFIPHNITLSTILLSLGTNLMTNTAITAVALPLYLEAFSLSDPLQVMTWFLTVTGLSFALPVANGCLAVTAGFGVPLKQMFKVGISVVLAQLAVFLLYYNTIGAF